MADAYFPYDVRGDPSTLGLEYSLVPTRLGVVRLARSQAGVVDTLFLHGVGLDSSAWTPLLQAAEGDERTSGWAFLDLPGFGGSADLERGFSLEEAAGAVIDVLDAVGSQQVHLVGYSMGGFLALHLAANHPERVARLTTICGAYTTIVDCVNAPMRTLVRAPRTAIAYLGLSTVARLGWFGDLLLRAGARSGLLRISLSGIAAHPFRVPSSLLQALADGNRPKSFLYAQATGIDYDCRAVWPRVAVPVLAIFGASDALVSRRDAKVLADCLPAARIEFLENAAHFAPMEHPEAVYKLLV